MDEPVSGLDYGNQMRLLLTIRDLADEGYTFIQTTHFPDHALWMTGRVLLLKEGQVVGHGPTASTITRTSLSALYHLDMDVDKTLCGVRVCIPGAMKPGPAGMQTDPASAESDRISNARTNGRKT